MSALSPPYTVGPIVSSAQFVRDLDRAVAFYRDLLGFREIRDITYDDPTAGSFLGRPHGSAVRYKLLAAGEGMVGMIGLFALEAPAPQEVERADEAAHIGEAALVFVCSDLDAAYEALRARGHPVIRPPALLRNPDGSTNREMTFRDPDGVMINLMEARRSG
jgi:catechol 2,3-dioxygenase-like lactoylglutathione lyase family enzyme